MTRQSVEVVTYFLLGFKTGVFLSHFFANYKLQKSRMISEELKRAYELMFTVSGRAAHRIPQPYQICFPLPFQKPCSLEELTIKIKTSQRVRELTQIGSSCTGGWCLSSLANRIPASLLQHRAQERCCLSDSLPSAIQESFPSTNKKAFSLFL